MKESPPGSRSGTRPPISPLTTPKRDQERRQGTPKAYLNRRAQMPGGTQEVTINRPKPVESDHPPMSIHHAPIDVFLVRIYELLKKGQKSGTFCMGSF